MRNKAHNQSRFMRIITVPIRILCKARDFYVKSMTDCSEKVSCGNAIGLSAGQVSGLPKSFSVSSSRSSESEDLRELIRAVSTRSLGSRVDMELSLQQQLRRPPAGAGSNVVPRSCSVGMGRIDEDKACDFVEESDYVKRGLMYPRSRSYAVTKRSVVY